MRGTEGKMSKYKHRTCNGMVKKITIPQVDDEDRYICLKCEEWIKPDEVEKASKPQEMLG